MAWQTSLRPFLVRHTCTHLEVRLMREATAGIQWHPSALVVASVPCRFCRDEASPHVPPHNLHERDTQCVLDVAGEACIICRVSFVACCPACRGRGFHFPLCEVIIAEERRAISRGIDETAHYRSEG